MNPTEPSAQLDNSVSDKVLAQAAMQVEDDVVPVKIVPLTKKQKQKRKKVRQATKLSRRKNRGKR